MSRFYIYMDGRGWIELDVMEGKLVGFNEIQLDFLVSARGTLWEVPKASVLEEMQKDAAGLLSKICMGSLLPCRRRKFKRKLHKRYHTSLPIKDIVNSHIVNRQIETVNPKTLKQINENKISAANILATNENEDTNQKTCNTDKTSSNTDKKAGKTDKKTGNTHQITSNKDQKNTLSISSKQSEIAKVEIIAQTKAKSPDLVISAQSTSSKSKEQELSIASEDLLCIKRYLDKGDNPLGIDPKSFENDYEYMIKALYGLHPIVEIYRDERFEHYLRRNTHQEKERMKKEFVESLGLTRVNSQCSEHSEDNKDLRVHKQDYNKENKNWERKSKSKSKILAISKRNDSNHKHNGAIKKNRLSGIAFGRNASREYSHDEDQAIVRWLLARDHGEVTERARLVKGNSLWQRLEGEWREGVGNGAIRTWHSLRNRYLRYILPSLHLLDLAPNLRQKLREAAALGDGSTRFKKSRRNSIWENDGHNSKKSASARRILKVTSSTNDDHAPRRSPRCAPPLPAATSAPLPPVPLTYSALTRKFADRSRTPSASPSLFATSTRVPLRRKLYNPSADT